MKRLTFDDPQWNTENMLNRAFVKDRQAYLRGLLDHGKEDISLVDYCASECSKTCKKKLNNMSAEDFGDYMDCDCPIALLYWIAVGAAELRERLKDYEDKGLDPDGKPLEPGHLFER
jgi:hypothetical protein